ncbi:N-acetylmuramoyl-L-alanine amidase family protein [Clostridium sp. BL-8]|uniref:N-acetylmuramoyl-L-alanine amidase family protein n=1 Tax=Clostridium sp. BL-8 TaxID=349938 RepID=UPI00098CEEA8|nr:N-acetylmuramoyl-L-alanine amidase family protein [Clostridium sp. BL-8]OOM74541.1 toxin A [Clostridium sp. BL-8]
MIKKITRIMSLILVAVSISTIFPIGTTSIIAKAADTSDISSNSSEEAVNTVIEAMIPTKLNAIYSNVGTSTTVSQFKECGSLSYTLNAVAAATIAKNLINNMSSIVTGVTAVKTAGTNLIAYGKAIGSDAITQKGTALYDGATTVLNELNSMSGLSEDEFVAEIQSEAKDIPVYEYTVVSGSGVAAQGFAIGGILGLAANPADTYNGIEKDAEYSSGSSALVPSLPLTGSSAYNKTIDLDASGTSVICDGLNINLVNSSNNKVYAINNPVYNMILVNSGAKTLTTKDVLNVVDFSGVTNLKGGKSDIDLSSEGISTNLLSLSLTNSDSKSKVYEYALPVEDYEKNQLDSVIDGLNLSSVGDTIKGMIKTGTYTLIPNVDSEIDNSQIGNAVNDVTNSLDDLSDALDDFTDALKDKDDDVDDAWDKVFDRFDNEPGWGKHDGYIYYYDKDGVSLKGVQKIKGKTYYFNRIDGAMETGWQIVDGKRCYFDKKKGYEIYSQWVQDGDDRYFVGEDGAAEKMQWVNDGGKSYYLKADGKMTKGWLKIDDYWYYFNENGIMETSAWKWSDGKWYYLKDNGQAAVGWLQLDNEYYYFSDPSGEMQTGWFRADGNWYCSNDDGSMKTGWADSKDGWCYLDDTTGVMKKNEWVTIDGKTYYFNINGNMVTGSRYIDGTKYVFNSDGTLGA